MSSQVYDRVTRAILERLESGRVPWHQPWHAEGVADVLVDDGDGRKRSVAVGPS